MHGSYTLICSVGAVPERFDRVTKHFTVGESAKCIVTASSVFCFLPNTVHTEENGGAHIQRHVRRNTRAHPHLCADTPTLLLCASFSFAEKLLGRQWKILGVPSSIRLEANQIWGKIVAEHHGKTYLLWRRISSFVCLSFYSFAFPALFFSVFASLNSQTSPFWNHSNVFSCEGWSWLTAHLISKTWPPKYSKGQRLGSVSGFTYLCIPSAK